MTALKKNQARFSSANLPNINSFNLWGLRLIDQHSGSGMSPMDGHISQTVLELGRIVASKHASYDCGDAHGRYSFGEGFPDYHTNWSESLTGFNWYTDLALAADAFRKIHDIAMHLAGIEHIGFRRRHWNLVHLNDTQMSMLTAHHQWRKRYVIEASDAASERCLIVFMPMEKTSWYRITLDPAVLTELRATQEVARRQFRRLPRWLDNMLRT